MRASSQNLVLLRRSTRNEIDAAVSDWRQRRLASDRVRFVPSGLLVAASQVLRLWLGGGKLSTLGIAGLVWSVTPRTLKLVAAGFAAAGLIVLAGALAALTLLAIQLT